MEIIKHPNDILRTKCTPITKNDSAIIATLHQMRKWIIEDTNNAVGLALPQVGILKQGFVFFNGVTEKAEIVINPKILKKSKYGPSNERCLSIPGQTGIVARAKEIEVMYQDVAFKWKKAVFKRKTARVFQHEYDHLQGILYIDLPQLEDIEVDEEEEVIER